MHVVSLNIQAEINKILDTQFYPHPFSTEVHLENARQVMGNYLAMSQAFPFIQAGSQKELIFDCIERNQDVPQEMEQTSVVANFLAWDETGGHFVVRHRGVSALSQTLDTNEYFHANLLKKDLETLFGYPFKPYYSAITKSYLRGLYEGLASVDPVPRCAAMVAFEAHAERMIDALWISLSRYFAVDKDRLIYFSIHTGGDDPAEAYHVDMTSRLIQSVVPAHRQREFLDLFRKFYMLNDQWCREISRIH